MGGAIRNAMGGTAVRIDHIGSTSVPGLDAKPVIDVQISVKSLESMNYRRMLDKLGYHYRSDNPDLSKRYFRESGGMRRTHIHVREAGSWSEQLHLLFRDYLRAHPEDCRLYADTKYRLMNLYGNQRKKYVEEKSPVVWEIMKRAHTWSQAVGWRAGESDI
ncbi:hypothetical protein XI25_24050 [Paenibacillus sp. DMB20]|nr:hypothetical protein XI25_24050 [Paenibacillus sp. DMB20]